MTQQEFAETLRKGAVWFHYKKKDGALRRAHGTLKMELIPVDHHPKQGTATGEPASADSQTANQTYYDLEKNDWRSFKWENFASLV